MLLNLGVSSPSPTKPLLAANKLFAKLEDELPTKVAEDWSSATQTTGTPAIVGTMEPMFAAAVLSPNETILDTLGALCHVIWRYNLFSYKERAFEILNYCRKELGEDIQVDTPEVLSIYTGEQNV